MLLYLGAPQSTAQIYDSNTYNILDLGFWGEETEVPKPSSTCGLKSLALIPLLDVSRNRIRKSLKPLWVVGDFTWKVIHETPFELPPNVPTERSSAPHGKVRFLRGDPGIQNRTGTSRLFLLCTKSILIAGLPLDLVSISTQGYLYPKGCFLQMMDHLQEIENFVDVIRIEHFGETAVIWMLWCAFGGIFISTFRGCSQN